MPRALEIDLVQGKVGGFCKERSVSLLLLCNQPLVTVCLSVYARNLIDC